MAYVRGNKQNSFGNGGLRPGNLRGLGSLGNFGGGFYSCYNNQCPPASTYGFGAQFYPGIAELNQYGGADAQESNAARINNEIKTKIQASLNSATQIGDQAAMTELGNIQKELLALDSWIRGINPPFKDAPLVPAHRQAEQLAAAVVIKAPPAPRQQNMDVVYASNTPQSASQNTSTPSQLPASTDSTDYSTDQTTSTSKLGLLAIVGVSLLSLVVIVKILRKKRQKPPTPAAIAAKKKRAAR